MAKGAIAKEEIFAKMMEVFEGSFMYNNGKELRINWDEEGNEVQIKVALTCAKEAVSPEGEVMKAAATIKEASPIPSATVPTSFKEPTPEEKQNVEDLLKSLGLD